MTDKSKPSRIETVTPSSLRQHQQYSRKLEDIAITENDERFKPWAKHELQHKNKLRILSTGKVGTGKSSLLNALVGSKFAIGHSLDRGTTKVTKYEYRQDDIDVVAWDCPGLQDGTNHEEDYLKDMVEKTTKDGGIDLLLYCIRMDDTRSDLHVHSSAMKILTERLGKDIWNNSLIVLTFANMYIHQLQLITESEDTDSEELCKKFNERMDHWEKKVTEQLKQMNVAENIIERICKHMYPAGFHRQKSLDLPGYKCWQSNLWAHAYSAAKDNCKPVLLKLNADRFEICTDNSALKVPAKNDHPERHTIYVTPSFVEILTADKKSKTATVVSAGGGALFGAAFFVKFTTLSTVVAVGAGATAGGVIGVGIVAGLLYILYQEKKNKDKKDS